MLPSLTPSTPGASDNVTAIVAHLDPEAPADPAAF